MRKTLLLLSMLCSSYLLADNDKYNEIIEKSLASTIEVNCFSLSTDTNISKDNHKNSFSTPYNKALAKAKEENKKILLEVILDNCKFCKKMEENVLSKESIQQIISKNFVFTQINADREPLPLGLSEQMSPMFVFVSTDENVQDMRFGYINEEDFIKLLAQEAKKK